jgi:hypothetical protein
MPEIAANERVGAAPQISSEAKILRGIVVERRATAEKTDAARMAWLKKFSR